MQEPIFVSSVFHPTDFSEGSHLAFAHEETPPEHVHALDLSGLLDPTVTLFSARRGGFAPASLDRHPRGAGDQAGTAVGQAVDRPPALEADPHTA